MSMPTSNLHVMSASVRAAVLRLTGAEDVVLESIMQSLWSGYGHILRLRLYGEGIKAEIGNETATVVVKSVSLSKVEQHPPTLNKLAQSQYISTKKHSSMS